ncbi:MAG: CRISPR-associated protein Cas4 [Bacillota bacterium]
MKITGTIINYYKHCRRQCWLFANRLNMEDNSEDVRIGRVLHELNHRDKENTEIAIDSIKLDKLMDEYLVELKKSDADLEAVRWQVLYYLKVLKDKGIKRKGRIEVAEKNKQDRKIHTIELTEEIEKELMELMSEINQYLIAGELPEAERLPKCKKCAYYEYCFI